LRRFCGDRAEIHPLIVFFSVLGGLLVFVFGAVGVFVAVLCVISLTLVEVGSPLPRPIAVIPGDGRTTRRLDSG
jgi:predicted PurR-regulated permease PerM